MSPLPLAESYLLPQVPSGAGSLLTQHRDSLEEASVNRQEYAALAEICEHAARVLRRVAEQLPSAGRIDMAAGSSAGAENPQAGSSTGSTRLLLTIAETAEALRTSRTTVYALVRRGEIPSIKIGSSRRVVRQRLEAWVAERPGD